MVLRCRHIATERSTTEGRERAEQPEVVNDRGLPVVSFVSATGEVTDAVTTVGPGTRSRAAARCVRQHRRRAEPGCAAPDDAARAAVHVADPAVLLSTQTGTVSVRTATGGVGFRAPNGIVAPDHSTIVQAEPMTTGTRVVASDAVSGAARWSHDVAGSWRVRVVAPGGRYVALVDGKLQAASIARTTTVVTVATATHARHVSLRRQPRSRGLQHRRPHALRARLPACDEPEPLFGAGGRPRHRRNPRGTRSQRQRAGVDARLRAGAGDEPRRKSALHVLRLVRPDPRRRRRRVPHVDPRPEPAARVGALPRARREDRRERRRERGARRERGFDAPLT